MKLNILRTSAAVLIGLLLILSLPLHTSAANRDAQILIPVKVTVLGTQPEPADTYTIRITPDNTGFPMPNGQVGGSFELQLSGVDEAVFPPITYSTVGEYTYKIEQIAGTNPKCKYDQRTYTMKIIVSNDKDGGLAATVILHEVGKPSKPDTAEFTNEYKSSGSNITPPKTGDDNRIFIWCVLLVTSGVGMMVTAFFGKKEKGKYAQ